VRSGDPEGWVKYADGTYAPPRINNHDHPQRLILPGDLSSTLFGTPVATGTANSPGVSGLAARADHVHDWTRETRATNGRHAATVANGFNTTYVDVPGPLDVAFTKSWADTSLLLIGSGGGYVTGGPARVTLGVRINNVDYDLGWLFFNSLSMHMTISGSNIITGLAAGSYTARWRIMVTTQFWNTDTNDLFSLAIVEI